MAKAIAAILTLLLLAGAEANAGEAGCGAALADASPFYCRLGRVDTVRLQLQGSAETLGAHRTDLEHIMRERMQRFSATLPEPFAATSPLPIVKRPPQGQLLCTVWTVGQDTSIALFVECALQAAETGDSVEARLLGRTTQAEFDMATRVALGQVIAKVTDDYNGERDQRVVASGKRRIKTAGPAR